MTAPGVATVELAGHPGLPLLVVGPSLGTAVEPLWGRVAALLGDRFHVVGWELPGHGRPAALPAGRSSQPATAVEGLTMRALAGAVHAAVQPHRDERAAWAYAGDSVGGAVGLQLLLDHGEEVSAAVLCCTGARIGTEQGWRERAATVLAEGTASMLAGSRQRWFAPGFVAREPAVATALLDSLVAAAAEGYAATCAALATFDVRDRLGEITQPVLAVAGRHDEPTPVASLAEVATGVEDGRLEVLEDVAHLAPAEAPAEVARLVAAHLR